MIRLPKSLKAVWPLAWASTVRDMDRQLNNAAHNCVALRKSHEGLCDIHNAAVNVVVSPPDAASRGAAIAALNDELTKFAKAWNLVPPTPTPKG
jgi:hypothetical protein